MQPLRHKGAGIAIVFCLLLFLLTSIETFAGELAVNVHGLSYHPDRRDSSGKKFNELNFGLGLNYLFRSRPRALWSLESGVYLNSFDDPAAYAALSYKYRLTPHWSAGIAGSFFVSKSYHNGDPFVAPFPVVSYRQGHVGFTMVYFPHVKNFNPVSVFGMYASLYLF